jgi:hypothetical protein
MDVVHLMPDTSRPVFLFSPPERPYHAEIKTEDTAWENEHHAED